MSFVIYGHFGVSFGLDVVTLVSPFGLMWELWCLFGSLVSTLVFSVKLMCAYEQGHGKMIKPKLTFGTLGILLVDFVS